MQHEIKKYPVRHPLLKKYIKFFWEIHAEQMQLNHKIIPQRNINLKFNLSETPHYVCFDGREQLLEDVYFSGLQDHFRNAYLKFNSMARMLGICFYPEGFYPFLKIPVSEFKNQVLGAGEVGFKLANTMNERLKGAPDVTSGLAILENELVVLLNHGNHTPENFRQLFNILKQSDNPLQIAEFCRQNNIGVRQLERMYNKYVGVSAKTYVTLSRFLNSLNQLLYRDYSKLSDIAYGNGYFDQMHFIKDFKRFAGNTPRSFVDQNDSMLQIGKLT
ncbi:MAG TPA: AraC family transcriptional regulator [Bacteroidales bacterium]